MTSHSLQWLVFFFCVLKTGEILGTSYQGYLQHTKFVQKKKMLNQNVKDIYNIQSLSRKKKMLNQNAKQRQSLFCSKSLKQINAKGLSNDFLVRPPSKMANTDWCGCKPQIPWAPTKQTARANHNKPVGFELGTTLS